MNYEARGLRVSYREVEPKAITTTPIGALVQVGNLGSDEIAVFGDEDMKLAADRGGHPTVPDESERVISRWVAEHSSAGMFEIVGTWFAGNDLNQGTLATGASENYLLLTDIYIRGAVPPLGGNIQTNLGPMDVPAGHTYVFAIPLVDIALVDGNKRDIAVANDVEGVLAKWIRSCDSAWTKIGSGNPWHKDNAPFAQAVLDAAIAAKLKHPDEKVRASAAEAQNVDKSKAFSTGRRTTFRFAVP